MIDYDKLDALMELPVSEEMLGAYLEGNLHGSELREVQNIIEKDPVVADIISSTDDVMQMNDDFPETWIDDFNDNFENDLDFQLISTNDFALPEIILNTSLGGENILLIQDTALAQLHGEVEDGTNNQNIDDIDPMSNGICDVNSEF